MFRLAAIAGVLALGLVLLAKAEEEKKTETQRPVALQIRLDNQSINPISARFIRSAIEKAEEQRAECLIIMLDTPGGLLDSTRQIVKDIIRSEVPVVVYVAPSGSRAASAGVFITLSAHVAAMAPGTNIGAAHPVQAGGLPAAPPPKEKDNDEPRQPVMQEKILNDTVAWARALADLRGRNADWATRAVRESISVSATEAVKEGAVDLVARNVDELLTQIDGKTVELPRQTVQLRTDGAEVRTIEMWWGEQLLGVLSNPNVALILMLVGFYGILFEFYSPGWGVAGTLGVVALLLGFFALAVLPINYVGLALIFLALAMFIAEVFVTSFGFLTLGGVVCLILGGLMLVESPEGFEGVYLGVLIPVALATAAITFFLVGSIVRAHRGRVQTGGEGLVGKDAKAVEDFTPRDQQYTGHVWARGERWRAISSQPVAAEQMLTITKRDGLTLTVEADGKRETEVTQRS